MVAANQRMGAAVVLHDQGVQHGFARAGEDVGDPQRGEDGAVLRVVRIEHSAVGQHAELMAHVLALGHLHQRLEQQAVDFLQRVAMDVFVAAVQRVGAGDETGHSAELLLFVEQPPGVAGLHAQRLERPPVHPPQHVQRAAQGGVTHAAVDGIDPGMVAIGGAEQMARPFFFVVVEDVLDLQDGDRFFAAVGQRHLVAHRQRLDHFAVALANGREAQGHRPDQAVAQPSLLEHGLVIGLVHEALVGGKYPGGDHLDGDTDLEVDAYRRQLARLGQHRFPFLGRHNLIDQLATVRLLRVLLER